MSRRNARAGINLLPGWAARRQKRRLLWIRLSVFQAAICLGLSALAWGARLPAARARQRLDELAGRINQPPLAEAGRVAEAARSARARLSQGEALAAALPAPRFDYRRLAHIHRAVPEGATVLLVEAAADTAWVTVSSAGLEDMKAYQETLAGSGLFAYARFGRVQRMENGGYRYVMTVGWARDE